MSPKDRFKLYLKDAKRIYMEAIGASGQTLGFAVVDRLERIVDYGGITSDDLEVYNEKHEVIAVLRCMAMYEEICDGDDELLSISKSPHNISRRIFLTFQDTFHCVFHAIRGNNGGFICYLRASKHTLG